MSNDLGPIEIICDAPPYPVVRACAGLGFRGPQDVRWSRIDRRASNRGTILIPWKKSKRCQCACGEMIPVLESYTFTFTSGDQAEYYLGQCRRCGTISWDQDE